MQKPRSERRPCPQPPRGLMQLLEKDKITRKDLQAYNSGAYHQYNTESLNQCEHCGRTFGDKPFKNHRKICTAERPFKPLARKGPTAAGKSVGKVRKARGGGVKSSGYRAGGGAGFGGGGGGGGQAIGGGGGGYNLDMEDAYEDVQVTMVACRKCGRKFGEARISKHEKVCKANKKPKKVKLFHKPITEKEKAKEYRIKSKKSNWREQSNALKNVSLYIFFWEWIIKWFYLTYSIISTSSTTTMNKKLKYLKPPIFLKD